MTESLKGTITKEEYLQLTGLVALAKRHRIILEEIVKTGTEILQEVDDDNELCYHGHFSDLIWIGEDDTNLKEVLKNLNVTISNSRGKTP